jgi:hypothetical protein
LLEEYYFGQFERIRRRACALAEAAEDAGVDDVQASEEFQKWLHMQSRFHDYSYRNTLPIKQQCSEAVRMAGYPMWQQEFSRHVK